MDVGLGWIGSMQLRQIARLPARKPNVSSHQYDRKTYRSSDFELVCFVEYSRNWAILARVRCIQNARLPAGSDR